MQGYASHITPEQIIQAYRQGIFPMATGLEGEIDWFIADPRTVVPIDERFRVRRSLRQAMRKMSYEIRINTAFAEVIRACARHDEKSEDGVWLSEEMIALYTELHRRGVVHSVEVWMNQELIGGLYGVAIQGAFFGESMFTRVSYASQIALVALVERLRERRYRLLDAQMRTPHIAHFGALDISHDEYLDLLFDALQYDCRFV
ncbi:MAG: leucyl/phenylalanyl-tRNA--protein transferase [Acidobacteria bacterium]|nr:leucyl/phenylalanyl-tRNA--protein transferase [Acidobacteriota bacterium]